MWTGGFFSLMTKGGSLSALNRIQSASDRHFPLPYFDYSYDKVSDKN